MKRNGKNRKSAHLKTWSTVPVHLSTDADTRGTVIDPQPLDAPSAQANLIAQPDFVAASDAATKIDQATSADAPEADIAMYAHAQPDVAELTQLAEDQTASSPEESFPRPSTSAPFVAVAESLGQRFAAAREQRGWSCDETARRLHLPTQIVRSIEADQFERIGYGVYLRGYLISYARLVDVPASAIEAVLHQQVKAPDLIASGRISHSRFLFQRYSGSAVYVVLTGFIVVPFVMFAMNLGGDVGSRLTPLDVSSQTLALPDAAAGVAPKNNSVDGAPAASADAATPSGVSNPAAAPNNEAPLMASFAMFPNQPAAAPVATMPSGQMRLSLSEASWVEIVDADGKRLEYATLPAGTVKSYASDKPLDVRLGNTLGAKLEVGGQVEDIAPYNRGNVAHFKLFAGGKPISKTE